MKPPKDLMKDVIALQTGIKSVYAGKLFFSRLTVYFIMRTVPGDHSTIGEDGKSWDWAIVARKNLLAVH